MPAADAKAHAFVFQLSCDLVAEVCRTQAVDVATVAVLPRATGKAWHDFRLLS